MHTSCRAMLDIRDLQVRFGDARVIESVNILVRPAEFVAVLGPSGCGKTTLLRIAAGTLRPSGGSVANNFRRTAMVFQESRLAGWMTALQNAAFGLKAAGVAKREREQRAREVLLRLGLEHADLGKRPSSLSGGMRQRVGIARALAVRPDLMLLDEPFSSLDIGLRGEMQSLVRREVTEMGIAALIVTHDLPEAVRLADRIVVLSRKPSTIAIEIDNVPRDDEAGILETAAHILRRPEVARALLPDAEYPAPAQARAALPSSTSLRRPNLSRL